MPPPATNRLHDPLQPRALPGAQAITVHAAGRAVMSAGLSLAFRVYASRPKVTSFVPGYTGTDSRNAEPYDHYAPLQGGLSNAVGGPGFGRFCRTLNPPITSAAAWV